MCDTTRAIWCSNRGMSESELLEILQVDYDNSDWLTGSRIYFSECRTQSHFSPAIPNQWKMILARLFVTQILLIARSLLQNVSDRVKKDHSRAILLFKVLSTKMLFVIEIVGCPYIQKYINKRKTISKFLSAIQNLQNNYHLKLYS